MALTIGQLARATGVTAKTIRYYEQVGVLPPPNRTPAGYRLYDQRGVHRLRFVRRARALGLSLRDVRALTMTLNGAARPAVRPRMLALVRERLSAVQHRIGELEALRRELGQVARRIRTSAGTDHAGGCRCL